VDFGRSTEARVLTHYLAVRSDETKVVFIDATPAGSARLIHKLPFSMSARAVKRRRSFAADFEADRIASLPPRRGEQDRALEALSS
jgi:hypothetical protein